MIKIEKVWKKQQAIVVACELQDQIAFDYIFDDRLAKRSFGRKTPATTCSFEI